MVFLCNYTTPLNVKIDHCLFNIGAYLPSPEHPQAEYNDYFQISEEVIARFSAQGPFIFAGDLNAHFLAAVLQIKEEICGLTLLKTTR